MRQDAGNEVRIEGDADRVVIARRVLEELYKLLESGKGVRGADVRHVIRMLSDQPDVRLSDVYENVLSQGSRRVIRAKNLAQRRYVDLIGWVMVVLGLIAFLVLRR